MLKKMLFVIGGVIALLIVVVLAAGIFFMLKVDKAFIEARMAKALSRQVHIEKINVGIFSLISGMEVKKITLSNFKTAAERDTIAGKPIAPSDTLASIETVRLRLKVLSLLKRRVDLKELILYQPIIHLSRDKQGVLNCEDLLQSKMKPNAASAAPARRGETAPNPRPLTADDIPFAVIVGQIGVKDGTINFHDLEHDQKFQAYKLTALAYDIAVDPAVLAQRNEVKMKIGLGLKTIGPLKNGSVQDFDLAIEAAGKMKPFDVETRQLAPELMLHVGFPSGQVTGLQIFHAVASVPLLRDYLGEQVTFLKEKQVWKDSRESAVDVHYKSAKATLKNGRLDLPAFKLLFDGTVETETKAMAMNLAMVLKKERNNAVKTALAGKMETMVRNPQMKKYADPARLADAALHPLWSKDGAITMKFNIAGTTKKADVKLIEPQLASLEAVIKKSIENIMIEGSKSAHKELTGEGRKRLLEEIPSLFQK